MIDDAVSTYLQSEANTISLLDGVKYCSVVANYIEIKTELYNEVSFKILYKYLNDRFSISVSNICITVWLSKEREREIIRKHYLDLLVK